MTTNKSTDKQKQAPNSRAHLRVAQNPEAYCVAVTGKTFERRGDLKFWGFHWNAKTRTWNRLIKDIKGAKMLARYMANGGYQTSLHAMRPDERVMSPNNQKKLLFSSKKLIEKKGSYSGSVGRVVDFGKHYTGGNGEWRLRR